MTKKDTFHEWTETVADLKRDWDLRVKKLEKKFNDIQKELEARFGSDDSHVIFRELPKPKQMNKSLTDTLMERRTQRTFSDEPLTDTDLATILWAADGVNRKNGKRTMPSALNWRETDIYVLKANGIWRWDSERHGLLFLALDDIRHQTIPAQPTLRCAPVHLVFVSNQARTETLVSRLGSRIVENVVKDRSPKEKLEEMRSRSMTVDAGIRIGAVCLAASALDLSCVVRTGFDRDKLEKTLHLHKDERIVAITTLGYRPSSILDTIS